MIDAVYPGLNEDGRERFTALAQNSFFSTVVSKLTPRFVVNALLKTAYGDASLLNRQTLDRYYYLLRREGTREDILTTIPEDETTSNYIDMLENITVPTYIMWGALDT